LIYNNYFDLILKYTFKNSLKTAFVGLFLLFARRKPGISSTIHEVVGGYLLGDIL
jgi:hypothetical protein